MAKTKKTVDEPDVPEPAPAPVPEPVPDVEQPKPFPEVDNTPEPPKDFYPDVIINNDPNAVMATEAEKAAGLFPKSTADAPKASDYPDVEVNQN